MADKLALITGASSGIGLELARIAAGEGYDLLLVADTPFPDLHGGVRGEGSIATLQADLGTIEGVDRALAATNGRPIDLLCANAGQGHGGPFLDQEVASWRHVIETNVVGTVYLLQRVLTDMAARDAGKVLITGSIAGFVPGAYNAIYNATKAFVDNFASGIRYELKDRKGLTITTLMPGATDTAFFERADMMDTRVGTMKKDDPADVARTGWDALMAGRDDVIHGLGNKIATAGSRFVPEGITAAAHAKLAEPGTAK